MKNPLEELGNAGVIKKATFKPGQIAMAHYEEIFDYYSEEPISISIKPNSRSYKSDYREGE